MVKVPSGSLTTKTAWLPCDMALLKRNGVSVSPLAKRTSLAAVAGFDANFACFGPGVDASHSYERTTIRAVEASGELLAAYLASECR